MSSGEVRRAAVWSQRDEAENIHQSHIMKGFEYQKNLDKDEAENINQGHITKCLECQESLDTA